MTEGFADLWRLALDAEKELADFAPTPVDFIRLFWRIDKRGWQIYRQELTEDEIFAVMCFAMGDYATLDIVLSMIKSHGECQIVNCMAWGRDLSLEALKEYRRPQE